MGLFKAYYRYQFLKIWISISDLVLTGLSEIGKNILYDNDLLDENANFSYLRSFEVIFCLFLACYDPGISVQRSQ